MLDRASKRLNQFRMRPVLPVLLLLPGWGKPCMAAALCMKRRQLLSGWLPFDTSFHIDYAQNRSMSIIMRIFSIYLPSIYSLFSYTCRFLLRRKTRGVFMIAGGA